MQNIAIICGGYSGESVISIQSAQFVRENLNANKYKGFPIIIDKSGWYFLDANDQRFEIDKNDFSLTIGKQKVLFQKVFNIIHGDPGENGKMQAYFEMLHIPATSSDAITLALTFNKAYCNKVVANLGVNIAAEVYLNHGEKINTEEIIDEVGLPCFVKPNAGGSSIGMSKVKEASELLPAIEKAFQEDHQVLIEEFIEGRELTCGLMISNEDMYVLPLCEVVSGNEWFDFEAKYTQAKAQEIIPADISADMEVSIKNTSVYLYQKLKCKGIVRMDYIIKEGKSYFLEVNTIPGLSAASIVPQMAKEFGWTYTELIDRILDESC